MKGGAEDMKKKTVWSWNFTIIALGTLISAIGGAGITLGLSLVVFDQTQSTLLSGIYTAIAMVPGITLPVLFGPLVDRANRKHIIVGLDALSGLIYLSFMVYIHQTGFSYGAYIVFNLVTGCIWQIYNLAYCSLYPDLIPEGMEQKGYAVSGMIYPIASTIVTPVAAILYANWGIEILFLIVGVSLMIASAFESRIRYVHVRKNTANQGGLKQYADDMLEGIRYLKREKGVRSIYSYMMITNATGEANGKMVMAHFQTTSGLTTAMYGLLTSAETIGRLVGSAVHYLFNIPEEKRYALTVRVYMIFEMCDGIMLFVAYPVMLALRFVCGFLGSQTAALRSAAVQKYLPSDMRARVNGLFSVLASLGMMVAQLAVGALGEVLPYRWVAAMFAGFSFAAIVVLIVRNKKLVEPVYNFHV